MRGGANGHEAHRTSRGVLCCVLACDAKRAEAQPKPPDSGGGGGAPPAPPHTRLTCTCDVAWGVLTLYRGNTIFCTKRSHFPKGFPHQVF